MQNVFKAVIQKFVELLKNKNVKRYGCKLAWLIQGKRETE